MHKLLFKISKKNNNRNVKRQNAGINETYNEKATQQGPGGPYM